MTGQVGAHLHGDVDLATVPVLEAALDKLVAGNGDVHLGLAGLHFVDLSGASVLVAAATQLGPDRRLVLHDPPARLSQLLDGFWDGIARIRVTVP
jgi:anti-anti-sigma regulatory factor